MTQQKQLFGCNKTIVNVIKLDPTDILTPDDLFFIKDGHLSVFYLKNLLIHDSIISLNLKGIEIKLIF